MNEKSRQIIRAAAYLECASVLDMRAIKYGSQGRYGAKLVKAISAEADHLRDMAVAIRRESDAVELTAA